MPPRRSRPLARRGPRRTPRPKIVAVCEGTKTEPSYLKSLARLRGNGLVEVVPIGMGADPMTVVERALQERIHLRRQARRTHDSFDLEFEVWVVFDRDAHPQFKAAVDRALTAELGVAVSNPCFELWGILHFDRQDAALDRRAAQRRLRALVPGFDHDRGALLDAATIDDGFDTACANARWILTRRETGEDPFGNPSTTVVDLVESISRNGRRRHA